MRHSLCAFSVCAILAAGAGRAAPAADATLAISEVVARGQASPELAARLHDSLVAELVSSGKLRLVERAQLARVMKEQALASSGAMSDEVQVKVAQLVGAHWIAVGAVSRDERGLSVSLRAIDSSTAQVAFASSQALGADSQLDAAARGLAHKLEAKLTGSGSGEVAASDVVGDFDADAVHDGAADAARALSMKFPRINGWITESVPNGTASCSFGHAAPFAGQFFDVEGKDDVTEEAVHKGFFLLQSFTGRGCSGKVKAVQGQPIVKGDSLVSRPLKVAVDRFSPGAGSDPALAGLFAKELAAALKSQPQFEVAAKGAPFSAQGQISGPRGHRTIEVQIVDRAGTVIQSLSLPGGF